MNEFIPSSHGKDERGIVGSIINKLRRDPNIFDAAEMSEYWMAPLTPKINEYVNWYAENGLYLPKGYEQRPSDWTEVLRKIQRAFNLLAQTDHVYRQELDNAISKRKNGDHGEFEALVKDADEGMALFGKHIFDLWRK